MVMVSDPEDASKTSEMENVQLLSDGFGHLPGFACIGHREQYDHGRSLLCREKEGDFLIGRSCCNAADSLPMQQATSRSASPSEEMTLPR